ncbi:hypothetical protein J31TS4_29950 [Paenibacillus sp. J31TS4]|uniref:S-layer homology domain-containing protein n=1 Tax=Paenibacillus sp. J31TS4 TaxID=2807195 RepID=UPI001AFE5B36|nr:S-layer homology domain-containing protein [Paenibacillus sp. J31TS4]GIP39715.1 hypothetical protein J31TS4_29950 [Paenibacillus sp. J31TS4]
MKNKRRMVLPLALVLGLTLSSSAFAFSDTAGDPYEAQIRALEERGVVSGIGNDLFDPKGTMTSAQAVQLIVKGLGLNIDSLRFIKEPKASDSFDKVADNAWYAEAFVIAKLNGLPLDRSIDPNQPMTREQFAHLLVSAVNLEGPFPMIMMYINITDQDKLDPAYAGSIQQLLLTRLANLDKEGFFRPKDAVTRSEAAGMVHQAIGFLESHKKDHKPDNGSSSSTR